MIIGIYFLKSNKIIIILETINIEFLIPFILGGAVFRFNEALSLHALSNAKQCINLVIPITNTETIKQFAV